MSHSLLRDLPLLELLALEACLRLGSLARAADELSVTPSAISHRIRQLEGTLGVDLLERRGRGVVPTEAAAARQSELSALVADFRAATGALRHSAQQTLHIDVTPVLGATWLASQLPALRRALDLPALQVELSATRLPTAPVDPRTDILIELVAASRAPGQIRLFGACIGAYVSASSPLTTPVTLADLQTRTLLRQTVVDWARWCVEAFGQSAPLHHGVTLDDPLSALEACLAGGGPALLSTLSAAPYLDSGHLRQLHPARIDAGHYAISLTERGQLKPLARRAVDALVALAGAGR
ncbi:LysR family transcriptional regulator [Zoogloeaceae bacterium G21618-S1]|nr:LysR family transcriptional regulator [Zoogloeaceae bacterium G21618-S1]